MQPGSYQANGSQPGTITANSLGYLEQAKANRNRLGSDLEIAEITKLNNQLQTISFNTNLDGETAQMIQKLLSIIAEVWDIVTRPQPQNAALELQLVGGWF